MLHLFLGNVFAIFTRKWSTINKWQNVAFLIRFLKLILMRFAIDCQTAYNDLTKVGKSQGGNQIIGGRLTLNIRRDKSVALLVY